MTTHNDEYKQLPSDTQKAVDAAIAQAKQSRQHVSNPYKNGDVYAYPQGSGTVAWGVNGGEDGFCIARGTVKE